ncbi:MAG: hypothetical protein PHY34_04145 [Patescibacteria group bacterium]|nr:hypothetical protein [Patescibacteria group bacterium]MDD5715336.1 hypothetical protein [Patescibacteria group bacterium]
MDTVSHAGWGATVIRAKSMVGWAAIAGALPDMIPVLYGIVRYGLRFFSEMTSQRFVKSPTSGYMRIYYFTHSLVPASITTIILFIFTKSAWLLSIPYFFHILLDIPTHRGMWATRIVYPFSDFHVNGWSWWRHSWISMVNWTVLIAINFILWNVS